MWNLKKLKKAWALMVFIILHQKQFKLSLRPASATMPILFILLGGLLAQTACEGQGIFTGDHLNANEVYFRNTGTGNLTINGGNASPTYASAGLQAILNSQSTAYFTKKKLS